MKDKLISEIRKIEEVEKMPYLSPTEELIMKEAMEKGMEKGMKEGIKLALEVKFGGEGLMFYNTYVKHIDSIEKLEELKDKIRVAKSIKELT